MEEKFIENKLWHSRIYTLSIFFIETDSKVQAQIPIPQIYEYSYTIFFYILAILVKKSTKVQSPLALINSTSLTIYIHSDTDITINLNLNTRWYQKGEKDLIEIVIRWIIAYVLEVESSNSEFES